MAKIKVWSTAVADKKFGEWIKKRDRRCVLCKRKPPAITLTCSHYWGRYASATRYSPDNCDALCMGCHFRVENAKQGEYQRFKIEQLGLPRYQELEQIYYQKETTRREEILNLMGWLKADNQD